MKSTITAIRELTSKQGHRLNFEKRRRTVTMNFLESFCCPCSYGVPCPDSGEDINFGGSVICTDELDLEMLKIPKCPIDWEKSNDARTREGVNRVMRELGVSQEVTVTSRDGDEWRYSFQGEGVFGHVMLYTDLLSVQLLLFRIHGKKVGHFFHLDKTGKFSEQHFNEKYSERPVEA